MGLGILYLYNFIERQAFINAETRRGFDMNEIRDEGVESSVNSIEKRVTGLEFRMNKIESWKAGFDSRNE